MLPFLACTALSELVITKLGSYNISDQYRKDSIHFDLRKEAKPDHKFYLVIAEKLEQLYINDKKVESHFYHILPEETIHFNDRLLTEFHVVSLPKECESLEFILNPLKGNQYKFNKSGLNISANKLYCTTILSHDPVDIQIRTDSPSTVRYGDYKISEDLKETTTLKSKYGISIGYRPTTKLYNLDNFEIEITKSVEKVW